ncbi:MAG: hypothetical protein ABI548_03910 [Polyangiaceae bacterium]
MTRTAAQLLAQAARLLACALENWHDESEPGPVEKLPPKSVEVEQTRELLRRRGLR